MLEFSTLCANLVEEVYIGNKKKTNDVAVVIPTYKNKTLVIETIQKIKKQTLVPDIIVVDNNEDYKTFNSLTKKYPDVTVIKSRRNWGASGGQYLGGAYALCKGYDYIIFTDDDAQPVDNDLIEELVKNADEHTVTVPKHKLTSNLQDSKRGLKVALFHYVCVHRKILEDVGLPDFDIFIKNDDYEFTMRISQKHDLIEIPRRYYHPIKPEINLTNIYYNLRNYLIVSRRYRLPIINIFNTLSSYGMRHAVLSVCYRNIKFLSPFYRAIADAINGRLGRSPYNYPQLHAKYDIDLREITPNTIYLVYNSENTLEVFKRKFRDAKKLATIKTIKSPKERSLSAYLRVYIKAIRGMHRDRTLVILEPLSPQLYGMILLFKRTGYVRIDRSPNRLFVLSEESRTTGILVNIILTMVLTLASIIPVSALISAFSRTLIKKTDPADPCNVMKHNNRQIH